MIFSKKLTLKSSLTKEEFDFVFSKVVSERDGRKLFKGFKEGYQFEIRKSTSLKTELTSFYPIMQGVIQQDLNGLLIRAKVSLPKFTLVFMVFANIFMIFWFISFFHTNGLNSKSLNELSEFIAVYFFFQLAFMLVFYLGYKKMIKDILELFEAQIVSREA